MKNRIRSLVSVIPLALLAVAVCTGCAPKPTAISGSVFVVTKGRQNVKLALVDVHFYDEATANRLAVKLRAKAAAETLSIREEIGTQAAIAAKAQEGMREAQAELELSHLRAREAEGMLFRMSPSRPTDVPDYLLVEWDSLKAQHDQLVLARDLAENRFRAKQVELHSASRERARSQKLLDDVKTVPTWILDAFFEVYSSESIASTKTDADGKFTIELPGDDRYAVAATARRDVARSTENYHWFVWIPTSAGTVRTVMLSNDNLIDSNSPGSVVSADDLLSNHGTIE